MLIREIAEILGAEVLCGSESDLDIDIHSACGGDMMSDVLAFVNNHSLLLTGLVNPQVIRTAGMLDMRCVVFVRDKKPTAEILELARASGIVVLSSSLRMFTSCGKLYSAGLSGGCECGGGERRHGNNQPSI